MLKRGSALCLRLFTLGEVQHLLSCKIIVTCPSDCVMFFCQLVFLYLLLTLLLKIFLASKQLLSCFCIFFGKGVGIQPFVIFRLDFEKMSLVTVRVANEKIWSFTKVIKGSLSHWILHELSLFILS